MSETTAFRARKLRRVQAAEAALEKARIRLEDALREYDTRVEDHKERGDGFFPSAYLLARREAVLARKNYNRRTSQLSTARAEFEAATLEGLDA